MNKRNIASIAVLAFLLLAILGWSIYYKESQEDKMAASHCLSDNERVDFKIKRLGKYPSPDYDRGVVEISVKNADTNQETSKFKIDNIISPSHYHPIELHRCGVYVIRVFNYDPKKTKQDPGYKDELWKYDYKGDGKSIILFSAKPKEFISYFSTDFRVDPTETYVALERGYLGSQDYALVIKNLNTKEDAFVLEYKDFIKENPSFYGNFGLYSGWSRDGHYFWGQIFDGAYVLAFLRIKRDGWKVDVLPAPQITMGGDALNPDKGLVTYRTNAAPWTGDAELDQKFRAEAEKQRKVTSLYSYNLFTKASTLIATTTDPTYHFLPEWLSDTELQYELPSGENKIYKIK